jgi:dedicated sortase system histidine kinase
VSLRSQLLLITLLVLALPVAGWQFARQVEQTLRAGHAEALLDTTRTTARLLANQAGERWPTTDGPVRYVHQPATSPFLDGYADDWLDPSTAGLGDDRPAARLSVAEQGRILYLLVQVSSPSQVYSRPGRADGDRLVLDFQRADGLQSRVELAPLAPGWIESRGRNPSGWPRVQGYWQPNARGWTVELQVPDDPAPLALGWQVIDVDDNGQQPPARSHGSLRPLEALVRPRPELDRVLTELLPDGTRAWAVMPEGWVIAHARREARPDARPVRPSWLDTLLFERLASDSIPVGPRRDADTTRLPARSDALDDTGASWTTRPGQPGVVLSASAPLRLDGRDGNRTVGRLVLERDADRLLLESNRAVLRLLAISLIVFVVVAVILLAYATWLSVRIRRLRNAAEAAVGEDGQVRRRLEPPRAGDELGDLGRSLARLLSGLGEHQRYLRTLADKLAHELRTPLAMIRSSLDNLEQAREPGAVERYRERAKEGSDRLNRIFQAMSQASRIEQSLTDEALIQMDLKEFLGQYVQACRDTYPERRFELSLPDRTATVHAAPDLLAQLADKLVENAVDFSPAGSTIRFRLRRCARSELLLAIENDGPSLPDSGDTVFDSMVSIRTQRGAGVHLGLGLTIARLIADHHGWRIRAVNRTGGVAVQITIPFDESPS